MPTPGAPPSDRHRSMPCATVHLLTAGRTLDAARRGGPPLPFPVDDPRNRTHFLHGALAPDMGFIPGTERFVSEVSHYVRSADMARALVERASSPAETAFAWGWITHVLTDLELHPQVGRACGERVRGDRSVRMNAAEDLPAHVGTEVGLDIHFLRTDSAIPAPPRRPVFDPRSIGYLSDTLEEVYGVSWSRDTLLRTHSRSVAMTSRWPGALTVLAWGRGMAGEAARGVRGWVGRMAAGTGSRIARPGGATAGFFRPLHPPAWLVARVEALAAEFPERMADLVAGGIGTLPNHNLETGAPDHDPLPHENAEWTARRLEELRRAGGGLAPGPAGAPG